MKVNHSIQFYVDAQHGSDDNTGNFESPFRTLNRAQQAVRAYAGKKSVCVYIREGTYYLENTLQFTVEDSGTSEHPVKWYAYPGEKPVISGGIRLNTEWEPYKDGIYRCSLRGQKAERGFDQLFVNGKRKILARYPNGNPLSPSLENFTFIEGADQRERVSDEFSGLPPKPHKEVYFSEELFTDKRWERPEEAVLHIFPEANWSALQFRIKGIDYERRAILLGEGGHQQHERFAKRTGTDLGKTSRYYIENVFEELDHPGEWYYDRKSSYLYYMPESGENMQELVCEVPLLKCLISLESNEGQDYVSHIHFKGLRFTHTLTTFLDEYSIPSFGDWAIVRNGAIYFNGAEHCVIEDCFIDAVGGNAIFADQYNRGLVIKDNLITECGESAIAIVGATMVTRDQSYTCPYCGNVHSWNFLPHTDQYSRECFISNNKIHDIGVYGKQTAGVFMAVTAHHTISHNEIYNIPRAAICIHDGMYGGHLIEYNYLHHTCRETDEHGTFNAWGRDSWWCHAQSHRGESHPAGDVTRDAKYTNVLRYNLFVDFKGWGIDLDDGSSNYDIYKNVCVGVGIKTREGDFRRVHNNIVYLPTIAKPTAIQVGCEDNSDEWYNNIIYAREDCIHFTLPPKKGRYVKKLNDNCYYSEQGYFSSRNMNFEEWKSQGYDDRSIFADPMFVNPERFDFTVAPNSPVLKLGFDNFAMDKFGLNDFPNTWVELEPQYPVYDYDTMNREMLKNLRVRNTVIQADEEHNYKLMANDAKCIGCYLLNEEKKIRIEPKKDCTIQWQLKYKKGGTYAVEIEYMYDSDKHAELDICAFVESIGENNIKHRIQKTADGQKTTKVQAGLLSLSGEETDNISIIVRANLPASMILFGIVLRRV